MAAAGPEKAWLRPRTGSARMDHGVHFVTNDVYAELCGNIIIFKSISTINSGSLEIILDNEDNHFGCQSIIGTHVRDQLIAYTEIGRSATVRIVKYPQLDEVCCFDCEIAETKRIAHLAFSKNGNRLGVLFSGIQPQIQIWDISGSEGVPSCSTTLPFVCTNLRFCMERDDAMVVVGPHGTLVTEIHDTRHGYRLLVQSVIPQDPKTTIEFTANLPQLPLVCWGPNSQLFTLQKDGILSVHESGEKVASMTLELVEGLPKHLGCTPSHMVLVYDHGIAWLAHSAISQTVSNEDTRISKEDIKMEQLLRPTEGKVITNVTLIPLQTCILVHISDGSTWQYTTELPMKGHVLSTPIPASATEHVFTRADEVDFLVSMLSQCVQIREIPSLKFVCEYKVEALEDTKPNKPISASVCDVSNTILEEAEEGLEEEELEDRLQALGHNYPVSEPNDPSTVGSASDNKEICFQAIVPVRASGQLLVGLSNGQLRMIELNTRDKHLKIASQIDLCSGCVKRIELLPCGTAAIILASASGASVVSRVSLGDARNLQLDWQSTMAFENSPQQALQWLALSQSTLYLLADRNTVHWRKVGSRTCLSDNSVNTLKMANSEQVLFGLPMADAVFLCCGEPSKGGKTTRISCYVVNEGNRIPISFKSDQGEVESSQTILGTIVSAATLNWAFVDRQPPQMVFLMASSVGALLLYTLEKQIANWSLQQIGSVRAHSGALLTISASSYNGYALSQSKNDGTCILYEKRPFSAERGVELLPTGGHRREIEPISKYDDKTADAQHLRESLEVLKEQWTALSDKNHEEVNSSRVHKNELVMHVREYERLLSHIESRIDHECNRSIRLRARAEARIKNHLYIHWDAVDTPLQKLFPLAGTKFVSNMLITRDEVESAIKLGDFSGDIPQLSETNKSTGQGPLSLHVFNQHPKDPVSLIADAFARANLTPGSSSEDLNCLQQKAEKMWQGASRVEELNSIGKKKVHAALLQHAVIWMKQCTNHYFQDLVQERLSVIAESSDILDRQRKIADSLKQINKQLKLSEHSNSTTAKVCGNIGENTVQNEHLLMDISPVGSFEPSDLFIKEMEASILGTAWKELQQEAAHRNMTSVDDNNDGDLTRGLIDMMDGTTDAKPEIAKVETLENFLVANGITDPASAIAGTAVASSTRALIQEYEERIQTLKRQKEKAKKELELEMRKTQSELEQILKRTYQKKEADILTRDSLLYHLESLRELRDLYSEALMRSKLRLQKVQELDRNLERSFLKELREASQENLTQEQLEQYTALYKIRRLARENVPTSEGNMSEARAQTGDRKMAPGRRAKSFRRSSSILLLKAMTFELRRSKVVSGEVNRKNDSRDSSGIDSESADATAKSCPIAGLDPVLDLPETMDIAPGVWVKISELHWKKVNAEVHVNQRASVTRECQSRLDAFDRHISQCLAQITTIEGEIRKKSDVSCWERLDALLLWIIRQGQDEAGLSAKIDEPVMLLDDEAVKHQNECIVSEGQERVKILSRMTDYRSSIARLQWKRRYFSAHLKDITLDYSDIHMLRISKSMQQCFESAHPPGEHAIGNDRKLDLLLKKKQELNVASKDQLCKNIGAVQRKLELKHKENEELRIKIKNLHTVVAARKQLGGHVVTKEKSLHLKANKTAPGIVTGLRPNNDNASENPKPDWEMKASKVSLKRRLKAEVDQQRQTIELMEKDLKRLYDCSIPHFSASPSM